MHIKYWLDSSALLPEFSQKQRGTWGTCSVRTQLRCQNGEGQRWRSRRKAATFIFQCPLAGKLRWENAFTQHSY